MNTNPASAASVAAALQSMVSRAPERARAGVTTLETFDVYRVSLDACRLCAPIAVRTFAINCGARRPRFC